MGGFGNNNAGNTTATNPFANMMNNPMFPLMGSGFGMNQEGMNFPNSQPNPFLFSNPLLSSNGGNQQNFNSLSGQQNGMSSLLQNLQNIQQKTAD